jgi:4-alpha-glucanotransferase
VLGLGGEARMNLPGTATGNWEWRVREDQLDPEAFDWLGEQTALSERDHVARDSVRGADSTCATK